MGNTVLNGEGGGGQGDSPYLSRLPTFKERANLDYQYSYIILCASRFRSIALSDIVTKDKKKKINLPSLVLKGKHLGGSALYNFQWLGEPKQ